MLAGKMPAQAMGDGVLILVAGVLLITPGVITDIVGLSLLLPPFRLLVRKGVQHWIAKNVQVQASTFANFSQGKQACDQEVNEKNVVEGHVVDAHVVDD